MNIRHATPEDGSAFLSLVRSLAQYEELEPPTTENAKRLLEDAFTAPSRFRVWLAEIDGQVIAYAVTFLTYSTFRAKPTLYLEDLFVHPDARRQGVGRALMGRLRREAEALGCGRFEWVVLDWNEDAKAFYRDLGATIFDEFRLCRVDLGLGSGTSHS